MKKRFLSLLCVLALCLGLLPVTALAAAEGAPSQLYVGNQQVSSGNDITYWTTDTSGGLVSASESDSWNVKYDPTSATLTLSGATIKGGSDVASIPYGSGIYAQGSSNQPVALTIELIGENTITGTYGIFLNAEISADSNGTDASLTITSENNGSLGVSGSNHGIFVKSGTGNASLNIEKATVTSSTDGEYAAGVCVQSGAIATGTPNISLAVNGGSLTASGTGSSDGILFYVGSSQATGAITSLTVSDNAIVDAKTGGIRATGVDITPDFNIGSTGSTGGIVFDGTEGTVYGDVTLDEPLTVGEGETLTIPQGSTLNGNSNLTNNGTVTIENGGTLTGGDTINNTGTINVENGGNLDGTPTGTVVYAPTITTQPAGQEVTVGQTAEFTLAATGENLSYQWQYSNDNGTNWNDISGATGNSYTTDAATLEMNNYQYQCMVSNSAGSVTSDPVTLTVNSVSVTGVTLDTDKLELFTGESETLTAKVEPADATNQDVTWSSSDDTIATVKDGTVKAVGEGEATITVTTAEGSYTATCAVKVTDPVYKMTTDTANLDFGKVYTGYTQPAAQTVTITNTGNQTLTLDQPASTNSFEVGTLSDTELAPNEKATFTVQPKAGLAVGTYSENITVSGTDGATVTIPASFTVKDSQEKGEENAPAATPAPAPTIVSGAEAVWYKGSGAGLTFTSDADFAGFQGVMVDGTAISAEHYTAKSGSTVVTLKASYLETLSVGTHTVAIVSDTGTAGARFTIASGTTIPQTGDESNPVLWTVLLLVSGLALGGLAIAKRKKQQ